MGLAPRARGPSDDWSLPAPHRARLQRELVRLVMRHRPGSTVVSVEHDAPPRRSSWSVSDLRLHLGDGDLLHLVWKNLGREAPGSRAWSIKPGAVVDPRRELWTYEHVLAPIGEGPMRWGSVLDEAAGIYWLFLQHVSGSPLCEVGRREAWLAAATWLGGFHARFQADRPASRVLHRIDERLHRWWFRRAHAFAERRHAAVSRHRPGGMEAASALELLHEIRSLRTPHETAMKRVLSSGDTLLHGEFYPANILVTDDGPCRIIPVDWEMAAIGPPVLDLAALTSGRWTASDRAMFATAYRDACLEAGGSCPALEELLGLLEAALLLLAVQWMGWTDDAWAPPAELDTDWPQQAARSASGMLT